MSITNTKSQLLGGLQMKPISEFLFNPDPQIGGAVIPIVGMPGCGKSIGLTQIGIKNIESNNYVLWRGTKQAQWVHFLANDIDVVIWNHESVKDFESFITSKSVNENPKDIDLEEKGVTIKSFSDEKDLLKRIKKGCINVVNIAGLGTGNKADLYFFRKKWLDLFDELVKRKSGSIISFLFDEIGDVVPSQQQLKKPFYSLVAEQLPPKLSQMRKNRVFLYAAAHSTHDIHYFLWKIKSNSIIYMSNSVVKKKVTPDVDQSIVSRLDRGEFVLPPADKGHFELPHMAESLDWIPKEYYHTLRLDWTSDCEDFLGINEEEEEEQLSEMDVKKKLAASMYRNEDFDFNYKEIASLLGIGKSTVGNARKEY